MSAQRLLGMPRAHFAVLALAVALGLLACAIDGGGKSSWKPVPPQEWQAARGPVVPHDTFPSDCSLCHEGDSWHDIRDDFVFDHETETGVALVGAHSSAECLRCHNDRGPVAVFARQGCAGCHEDVHFGQLGDACTVCHLESAVDWRPRAAIAEHALTRFPLAGAHASTACWACHPGAQVGNFDRASTECIACHANDLRRAVNPDHQAQGWVDDCQRCHLPTDWSQAGFRHDFFALKGGHGNLACAACHPGNVFSGTPTDCFACHQDDYRATTDPNHTTAGFPTTCDSCHDTGTWKGASFNHRGIASGCVVCHLGDWQSATQPNHASNGISTACELCHDTRAWGDGSFSHPQFPTTGDHGGLTCQQCHPSPGSFRQFTCISCHEHSRREMDDEHDRVRGYVYQSNACYACHPDGKDR